MKEKGQALIEFIMILPVMLILVFTVVDFGRIISLKSDLENVTSDAILFYEEGKVEDEINDIIKAKDEDIKITIINKDDYAILSATKTIKPITPGLSYIAKDVFNVKASRVIKNE